MNDERRALIQYRLSQARDCLNEADVPIRGGMNPRSIMNRLYYAMFYAVLALLQEKQLGTSKHSGAISLFDREFVNTGVLGVDLSKSLHRAFELRLKGDYTTEPVVTKEHVDEILPQARSFVGEVQKHFQDVE